MSRSPSLFALPLALTLLAPALACGDAGTHVIEIRGSNAVVGGFEAEGWQISFEQLTVVIQDPALIEDLDGEPAFVRQLGGTAFDVTVNPVETGTQELIAAKIRASDYDGFDYYISPPNNDYPTKASAELGEGILDEMIDEGRSIRVVGSATDGVQTVSFDWSFSTNTLYRCRAELEIPADAEGRTVMEIQGEALFRNELQDSAAALGFTAIVGADANMDNIVTLEELAAAPLPMGYDAKDTGIDNLADFVTELSRSIGSLDGGSCEVIDPPAAD